MDTNVKGSVYMPLFKDLYYAEKTTSDGETVTDERSVDDKSDTDESDIGHM